MKKNILLLLLCFASITSFGARWWLTGLSTPSTPFGATYCPGTGMSGSITATFNACSSGTTTTPNTNWTWLLTQEVISPGSTSLPSSYEIVDFSSFQINASTGTITGPDASLIAELLDDPLRASGTWYLNVRATFSGGTNVTCSSKATGYNSPQIAIVLGLKPEISVSGSGGFHCPGGSGVALVASGADSYEWSPSAGLSSTTAASVTAAPAISTVYTVVGTNTSSGCMGASYVPISAVALVTSTVNAAPAIMCIGGNSALSMNLTATHSNFNDIDLITYPTLYTGGTSLNDDFVGLDGVGNQDNGTANVPIGFTFYYYGVAYNSVNVSTNGYINFGGPAEAINGVALPDAVDAPSGLVALFHHDMAVSDAGTISYQTIGSPGSRKFVVIYDGVANVGSTDPDNTGQIILDETDNSITLVIADCLMATATEGIQNLNRTAAITVPGRNGEAFAVTTGDAYQITEASTNGFTYAWSPSATLSSSTGTSTTATPASTTTYTVAITDAYSCTATASATVSVNAQPAVTVNVAPATACIGHTVTLSATSAGGTGTADYTWSGPGISSPTSSGALATFTTTATSSPGVYTVSLSYSDPSCITATATSGTVTPTGEAWTGAIDNAWGNGGNWSCGVVPIATDNIVIPGGAAPVIASTVTGTVGTFTVSSTASLTINSGGVLNVAGDLTKIGSITGAGKVSLNGSSSQTLYGGGNVSNLELNNSTGGVINNSSSDTLRVTGTLTLTSGTLTTNDRLMLISDASGTARIGQITGGALSGEVVIQQYIPSVGHGAWRFLGHPLNAGIPLSMLHTWFEITGPGGATNGFTGTFTTSPSAFYVNPYRIDTFGAPGTNFRRFENTFGTPDSNLFKRHQGIRIFFWGSKGQIGNGITPNPFTYRIHGTVNTGTQNILLGKGTSPGGDYNQISNPYPSPIDIGVAAKRNYDAGVIVRDVIYIYNASLGTNGAYESVWLDGSSYYIAANTSFQVNTATDGNYFNLLESDKVATYTTQLLRKRTDHIELKILDNTYHPYDMMYLRFDGNATDKDDIKGDAGKPLCFGDLDFYSLSADNLKLGVDVRPYASDKVIPLGIKSNLKQEFIIKAENTNIPDGGKLYLHDKWLKKCVLLDESAEYRFTITEDPASQGNNRFELGFKEGSFGGLNAGLNFTIVPNPAVTSIVIKYDVPTAADTKISVTTVDGKTMIAKDLGMQKKGIANISLEELPAGVYLVTFTSGNNKSAQTLVKE